MIARQSLCEVINSSDLLVGGHLAALLTLGWSLGFFWLVETCEWRPWQCLHSSTWAPLCHLPWDAPHSQVAAVPRMRDVWKGLAPTCCLMLSSSAPDCCLPPKLSFSWGRGVEWVTQYYCTGNLTYTAARLTNLSAFHPEHWGRSQSDQQGGK